MLIAGEKRILISDSSFENDPIGFLTYLHYLQGLSLYIERHHGTGDVLLSSMAKESAELFGRYSKTLRPVDVDLVHENMIKAWSTELYSLEALRLLRGAYGSSAVPWVLVQLWYAVSWAAAPIIAATCEKMPDNHRGMVDRLRSLAVERKLLPYPWGISCSGDAKNIIYHSTREDGFSTVKNSNFRSPMESDCHASVAQFLRTTHGRSFENTRKNHLSVSKDRQLRGQARKRVIDKVGKTTLFHALYRLRDKANYRDNEGFLWEMKARGTGVQVLKPLKTLYPALHMPFELLALRLIGANSYFEIVDRFEKWAGDEAARHVRHRAQVLREFV